MHSPFDERPLESSQELPIVRSSVSGRNRAGIVATVSAVLALPPSSAFAEGLQSRGRIIGNGVKLPREIVAGRTGTQRAYEIA